MTNLNLNYSHMTLDEITDFLKSVRTLSSFVDAEISIESPRSESVVYCDFEVDDFNITFSRYNEDLDSLVNYSVALDDGCETGYDDDADTDNGYVSTRHLPKSVRLVLAKLVELNRIEEKEEETQDDANAIEQAMTIKTELSQKNRNVINTAYKLVIQTAIDANVINKADYNSAFNANRSLYESSECSCINSAIIGLNNSNPEKQALAAYRVLGYSETFDFNKALAQLVDVFKIILKSAIAYHKADEVFQQEIRAKTQGLDKSFILSRVSEVDRVYKSIYFEGLEIKACGHDWEVRGCKESSEGFKVGFSHSLGTLELTLKDGVLSNTAQTWRYAISPTFSRPRCIAHGDISSQNAPKELKAAALLINQVAVELFK